MHESMLEWFRGSQIQLFRFWLKHLKAETKKELQDAYNLGRSYKAYEKLGELVGDEKAERKLERQLIHEFKKEEPELMRKSQALTLRLKTLINSLAQIVEGTGYIIIELEEAAGHSNYFMVQDRRESLIEQLVLLERELDAAEEIAVYLMKFEPIPNVYCSAEFREKLRLPAFKPHLSYIEGLLTNMANASWLRGNSEKLNMVNLFSLPQGKKALRIVYKIESNTIIICELFMHDDYERFFSAGKRLREFHGPFQGVFKPLALLAAGQAH